MDRVLHRRTIRYPRQNEYYAWRTTWRPIVGQWVTFNDNVRQEWLKGVVGRIVRLERTPAIVKASVLLPEDPALKKYSNSIMAVNVHALSAAEAPADTSAWFPREEVALA